MSGSTQPTPSERRIPSIAAILFLVASSGCDVFGLGAQEFMIRVDSISAPATIGPNQPLSVRFRGWVGPHGCYRLVRAPHGRTASLFEIRFHGEYRNAMCIQEPVPLDHHIELEPPFQDPFTIRVFHPPDPPLEKIVRIEPTDTP